MEIIYKDKKTEKICTNLKEAKKRTKNEVKILKDAYQVPDNVKNIGKDKKSVIS